MLLHVFSYLNRLVSILQNDRLVKTKEEITIDKWFWLDCSELWLGPDWLVTYFSLIFFSFQVLIQWDNILAKVFSLWNVGPYCMQVMTAGQRVSFEYHGTNYIFTVNQAVGPEESSSIERGMISSETYFVFEAPSANGIKVRFCLMMSASIFLRWKGPSYIPVYLYWQLPWFYYCFFFFWVENHVITTFHQFGMILQENIVNDTFIVNCIK